MSPNIKLPHRIPLHTIQPRFPHPPPLPQKPIISRTHISLTLRINRFLMIHNHHSHLSSPTNPHPSWMGIEISKRRTRIHSFVTRKNISLSLSYFPPVVRVSPSSANCSSKHHIPQCHIPNMIPELTDTIRRIPVKRKKFWEPFIPQTDALNRKSVPTLQTPKNKSGPRQTSISTNVFMFNLFIY